MAKHRQKRPRDPSQLAKLIVDIATGEVQDKVEDHKDPAVVEFTSRAGKKGGKARAKALTPEQRREIAKKAAATRWAKD